MTNSQKGMLFIGILILSFLLFITGQSVGKTTGYKAGFTAAESNVTIPAPVIKRILVKPKGIIVSVTLSDLEDDLKANATHLSSKQRKEILDAVMQTADLYKISPLILFSIIKVESDYRAWVTHAQVIVKKKKDNAIGLTGVLYSWWGSPLKKAGIIETKSDLYNPQTNILACGFIFNEMRKMPLKSGTTDPNVSAMRYYFGKNFKKYSDKIEAKIGSIIFRNVYE